MKMKIIIMTFMVILLLGCNRYEEGKVCVKSTGDCYESLYEQGYNSSQIVCDMSVQRMCWVYEEPILDMVDSVCELQELARNATTITNCWEGCKKWK